ncbi:MAG: RagB/SusD family nutrient uptake outer membrane protein [Filimonas sp.]|nr:RagB/SusD family nutrient uptake outer membrane protein [Filimonas sp.]
MKKCFYILLIIVAAASLGSCKKDILDTAPNYAVSSSTMWTTDNLTDLGVAGVYNALRGGGSGSFNMLYELYSMDRFGYTGQARDLSSDAGLTAATSTPGNSFFNSAWSQLYEGVKRANDAITSIPSKSPSDATKKARYIAECKFLRAYFYFRLNQLWQGVPVYTNQVEWNGFNKPALSSDSVWIAVIKDLTDAINETNLPVKYAAGNANYGHITKGAAYALRGIVYQYQNKYDLAIADFQQVQAAGYALYTGAGALSYKMLFKTANEQSPEMIFSMQNMDQAGYGGTTEFYCGNRSSWGSCWSTLSPSNELIDLYENADGSKFNWDNIIPGYSTMPVAQREVYFLRNNATTAELTAAQGRGAQTSLYLPTGNEARIAAAYANRDPRLAQTIITPYSTYLGAPIGGSGDLTYTWRWPFRNDNPPTQDLKSDVVNYGFYWYRKFVYEGSSEGTTRDQVPTDYPIIRYADIALRWAECINEQSGPVQQALDLINSVRSRAGMPVLQTTDASKPTFVSGQSDLRERIRNERRVEFPNEGVNFFDELRWGTWKQKKFTLADGSANGIKHAWGKIITQYVYQGDYVTRWPIPTSVIQITNGTVAKTPGWIY